MALFFGFLQKQYFMVVPAIALIVVLFFVVRFIIGAARKKSEGNNLGDSRAGSGDGTRHTRPA